MNRGINAFALGVRSVNPDAVVYVDWARSWTGEKEAKQSFERLIAKHDIDVITVHTDSSGVLDLADEYRIWSIGYNFDNSEAHPDTCLTAAVWNWESFYTPQINSCMKHNFTGRHYWESADTGIVQIAPLTKNAAEGTAEAIEREKQRLNSRTFDIFYGPIKDNNGNIRVAEDESMSDDAMLNSFDWYVEGVVVDER